MEDEARAVAEVDGPHAVDGSWRREAAVGFDDSRDEIFGGTVIE